VKTLLWAIAAIAMAVGLVAAAVRSSAGYVQIVLPPYRVELSLVLVLVLLVAVFAAAYFGMRLVSAMVAMPRQVREYREARRQQKARDTLMEALRAFFSGRYARAEKAAASAMDLGEQPALAATLAARAAHELRAPERRDGYLTRMVADGEASAADGLLKAITEADLLVKQQRAAEALNVLQALPQKHTAALRLELRALQLEKSWEASVAVIDQLEKRKVYDATQAGELRRAAITQHLKRCATGHATLDDAWRKIPATLQRDARVAAAAAEGYLASNAEDNAQVRAAEVIEQALAASWDSDLAGLYAACNTGTSQIERAERWLAAHPNDATLLLTLGRLCAREKLWGKARNYLDASLSVEPTHNAYLASAQLYEQLGDNDAAQKHYRKSLEQALARLHRANVAG
jgi:HemY protein